MSWIRSTQTYLIHLVEHEKSIVVSTTSELVTLLVPFEPADLLPVGCKLADKMGVDSNIAVIDTFVVRARGENRVVPGERADSSRVSSHPADRPFGFGEQPFMS